MTFHRKQARMVWVFIGSGGMWVPAAWLEEPQDNVAEILEEEQEDTENSQEEE